jgi:hypothetical protein
MEDFSVMRPLQLAFDSPCRQNRFRSMAALLMLACWSGAALAEPVADPPAAKEPPAERQIRLFDGKTLKGWQILDRLDFKGHGPVTVQDGELVLEQGQAMTGVRWEGEFPTMDYEVTLETRRIEGSDFFCGMTFPVDQSHCSLVLGGWGGSLTGLSSVDGFDASENETTGVTDFKEKQWYKVRLRVTKEKIEVWLDRDKIVNLEHADRKLSLRWEMDSMPPFGFATWYTTGGFRNIVLTKLDGADD